MKLIGIKLELVITVDEEQTNEQAIESFLAQTDVSAGWQVMWEDEPDD